MSALFEMYVFFPTFCLKNNTGVIYFFIVNTSNEKN